MRKLTIVLALAVLAACAKKTVPEGTVKGITKFQLGGGAAISQPGVDDYNPQVLQQGDNFLVLVFASNRSCGICTGHNLFIARSTTAYNNDAVFPAFENPTVMTVAGTPLNFANAIAFTPVLSGNNVRIYLTNAGGTIQQTTAMTPGGSYDTTLSAITNTTGATNATVVGSEFTGSKLYARQNGTLYSFTQATTDTPVAMATGQTAASLASVDGAFTSRYDGFFSLVDGTITAMSLYGNGGNLVSVNTAIAKARLSARYVSVMRGGGFKGGLMFISGVESGGSTQDMYVVDGLTVYQMWQVINPKPPEAPDGGGTATPTTTADPAFSPVAGSYGMPINVTMTSTTTGAIICYTTDGVTDPVCSATPTCTTGTTYATAVSVTYTTTNFRARACKAGLTDSAVVTAQHISDGTQPTTPAAPSATANGSTQVDLAWTASTDNTTAQAQIVYEICQTTINNGCNTFTATFTSSAAATSYNSTGLSASTTYYYRIRSRDLAGNTSGYTAQLSATTAAGPSVSAPTFSPVAGTFNATQNVTVTTSTGSSILCYSTDGSTPACDATPSCTTGNLYSSAVNIASTATLRAIGCRSGYTNSSVTVGAYTIDTVAPVISSTAPASSANVSNTQVSYTVSEACASGSITWTRTGGTADGSSPHARSLVGAELASGAHNSITITNNPTLVSGAIYSIAFNCTDAAGNAATTMTNTNVTYSATPGTTRIWETNNSVYSSAISGNTLYIGGNFTFIGPQTGGGAPIDTSSATITPSNHLFNNGSIYAVVPDGAGGWYVGGTFTQIGGVTRNRLARINADGTLHPFDPDVNNIIYAMQLSGNTLYIAGTFTFAGGQTRNRLAAIDTTISTNNATAFDPAPNGAVYALLINGTTLYVGGGFTTIGGQTRNRIAALNTTLSTNNATTWNPNANNSVAAMAISGTTIYVGGSFGTIGGQTRSRIAALDLTTDTNNATAWNPNGNNNVNALTISGSTVYAGGVFTNIGGFSRNRIAALDATTGAATAWNPNADSSVSVIAVSGSVVYVGGSFGTIGGQSRSNIAALDAAINTNNATAWNPGANTTVSAIAVSGSTVYLGGDFTMVTGLTRNYIAAIDLVTGAGTAWNPNANNVVNAVAVSGTTVYAGGSFNNIGGQPRNQIAALNALVNTNNATAWNPSASTTVNTIAVSGTTLYAGGNFSTIGGQSRSYIAALDTTINTNNATSWNPGANTAVNALAISGTTLYAGGSFTSIGGQTRNYVAALDTTMATNNATAWNPDANGIVSAFVVSGSTLYVGGQFSFIGGQARSYVAALDTTTGNASAWNPSANNTVSSIALTGTTLYVAGSFTNVGGFARSRLAGLDTTINTNNATAFNPNSNGIVRTIAILNQTLYGGGDFTILNSKPRARLAAVDLVSGTAY